ncbi:lytic transglycosylase domain-containing protein [uncultured Enterovirga sp.]|uniref:lytic transglycosylase domain-containing protein n=1 Tax=uncultured Enterovirga sp. TaxID=2026352 RepID=UPI0035CB34E5
MFLFTTPTSTAPAATGRSADLPVVDAIRQGAAATGTDFDYLLKTARRESALDPAAKAPTSSATGLFQFIEQTWLGLVKSDGDRLGLAEQAKAVTARGDGTLTVADPATRQALLDLRKDPQLASVMAGTLTRQNRDALVAATGRAPSPGELYMAHVLGARGAAELIATTRADPSRVAALDFPDAARANRGIFFDRGGRPRGAGEVYQAITSAQAGTASTELAAATTPVQPAPPAGPPGLRGLFQTGARTGPLSDAVAKIWRTNNDGRSQAAAVSFFPRSASAGDSASPEVAPSTPVPDASVAALEAVPTASVAASRPIRFDLPLPPVRPASASPAGIAAARPAHASPERLVASQGSRS